MQNNNTELVLIESRSARTSAIANYSDDRAIEALNKAKALVMAVWQGTGVATNKQLAEYFEVSEDVIRQAYRRNKEEMEADGVQTLKGEPLKSLLIIDCDAMSQSNPKQLTAWTPRAALRLGMLLRDSLVAKELRSTILDIVKATKPTVEGLEKQFQPEISTQNRLDAIKILKAGGHKKEYIQRLTMQMAKATCPDILAPEPQEMASLPTAKSLLTPTQLAKELKLFCKSNPSTPDARRVNSLLAELGYQESIGGRWSATQKAIDLKLVDRKPVDTNSRTQKDQLLWSADILPILSEHLPAKA